MRSQRGAHRARNDRAAAAVASVAGAAPGRLATLLVTYVALLGTAVIAPLGWPPMSAVAATEPVLRVALDSVHPAIASPGEEVRLTGSLTNAGTEPVAVHSVRVSTAYRGLDSRDAVQEWATDGLSPTPISLAEDQIDATLAPGSRVRFFVDVPAEALNPSFQFATLPVRVEVMTGQDAGEPEPLAGSELRTFLPWQVADDADFQPIEIAWLAPLTLPSGSGLMDPSRATRAAAWTEAIGPGSRNVALLKGFQGTAATFLIDPAILEPLDPVASLTEVVGVPEGPEPGQPAPVEPEPSIPESTSPEPNGGEESDPAPPSPSQASEAPVTATPGAQTSAPSLGSDPRTGSDGTGVTIGPSDMIPSPTSAPPDELVPPTPSTTGPTTQDAVQDLRERITELPQEQRWWLPVGDTDTGALLQLAVPTDDIAALVARAPATSLAAPGRTDVAWPLGKLGQVDLASLRRVWTTAGGAMGTAAPGDGTLGGVILPSQAVADGAMTASAVRQSTAGPLIIGYDELLAGIVAASDGADQDGRTVQRFLAETMAIYQQQPAVDRSVVVALPRTARPDAATLRDLADAAEHAPWLQDTTLSAVMDRSGDQDPVTLQAPSVDSATAGSPSTSAPELGELTAYSLPGESPLTPHRITVLEDTRSKVDGVTEIVPGTQEAQATWMRVLDRQYSSRWRQDNEHWAEPVDRANNLATEILTGLRINPTAINFLADEGLIRITVTNELTVPIDGLRMTVSPGNARLRILAQPDPITIGPESRATVQFRARAVAAGQVPLNTSLSTPNGTLVGEIEKTQVRVQPTGVWIYWLLGGVAGVILVLGLVRALRPAGGAGRTPDDSPATSRSDLEAD